MGPVTRCLGPFVPAAQPFQNPLPPPPATLPNFDMVKADLLPIIAKNATELINLAFLCASSYRQTDYNGGCNGARIRFAPQNTWQGYAGISSVLNLLQSIQSKYTGLSWADLIVYAGTLALNDPLATFCPGRTDATDGTGLQYVSGKNFWSATILQMRIDENITGWNDTDVVVLSARPRSVVLLQQNGYQGTWATTNPSVLSNQYFMTLSTKTWNNYTVVSSGYGEYQAQGSTSLYMLQNDINLLNDPNYLALVNMYKSNNAQFLSDFRRSWTNLMNIDRYAGPTTNICWNTSFAIGSQSTGETTHTNNGSIWVVSILLFLLSLIL